MISMTGIAYPDVHVYDSMHPSAGTLVIAQPAALLHTEWPAICYASNLPATLHSRTKIPVTVLLTSGNIHIRR